MKELRISRMAVKKKLAGNKRLPAQYLWIKADLPTGTIIEDQYWEKAKVRRVPTEDYTCWIGFFYIIAGAICPFIITAKYAELFFLFIPLGVIAWAHWIFLQKKERPSGYKPGHQYHKYKLTFYE